MGTQLLQKTLYTFNEAMQRLGTDEEGFRQALRYNLQCPEQGSWIRACVDSRSSYYLATLDGELTQRAMTGRQPALDTNGNPVNDEGADNFGNWGPCGSNRRTGYGAVYELRGVFVVSPLNLRWIAEEAKNRAWYISNLLAVAPLTQTSSSVFPSVHFVIVSEPEGPALPVPTDAKELLFFADDIERLLGNVPAPATPLVDKSNQNIDPRERTTLLCIIGALAKEAELDLSQHMKAGEAVKAMLPPNVQLSARTIGEHLKKVRAALENRAD